MNFKNSGDSYTWINGCENDFKLEGSNVAISSGVVSGSSVILTLSATPASYTGLSYSGHQGAGSPTIRNLNGLGLVGFRLFPVTPFAPKLSEREEALFSVYPNPVAAHGILTVQLTDEAPVTISIYDLNGRKVREYLDGNIGQGAHNLSINLTGLSKGMYNIVAETNHDIGHQKLIVE